MDLNNGIIYVERIHLCVVFIDISYYKNKSETEKIFS